MKRPGGVAALVVVLGGLLQPSAAAQQAAQTVDQFLFQEVALTREQMAAVERDQVVAKLVPSANDRDVTVFGVVRVDVPRSFFETWNLDFQRSLQMAARVRMGIFGSPASAADVAGIVVTPDDFEELRDCRPNSCAQKVPATEMTQMRSSFNWAGRDAPQRVTDYVRERVLAYVTDYRQRGNAAMAVYADRGMVQSGEVFADMLSESSFLGRYVPSLRGYLLGYPRTSLTGARDVIFWSADNLPRMKPVLKIAHHVVYSPPELPTGTLVATKLIYANHYFEAGLETLTALEREGGGITLLLTRRYRFDQLPGGLLNIRGRVRDAVRDLTQDDLGRLKAEYEQGWRAMARP
jgi:hypothetical protein